MLYKKIKSYDIPVEELRQLWCDTYCNPALPIITFDGVRVKFYPEMFDHAFYESHNRKEGDKSILSLNRCEKMLWIKDTLEDVDALIKQGWLKNEKRYDNTRRVTLVKGNYIVVIAIYKEDLARFITAYQIDNEENLEEIKKSPDWTKKKNAD